MLTVTVMLMLKVTVILMQRVPSSRTLTLPLSLRRRASLYAQRRGRQRRR